MASTPDKKKESFDQVNFLVHCIKHTRNGRPDFELVAKDLAIVSKAAAAKRYERMLKAHGVSKSDLATGDDESKPVSTDKMPATPVKTPAKRRQANSGAAGSPTKKAKTPKKEAEDEEAEDEKPKGSDEESSGNRTPLPRGKGKGKQVKKEGEQVKKEGEQESELSEAPESHGSDFEA